MSSTPQHIGALEALRLLARRLAETGWRGLALAHHESPARAALEALDALGAPRQGCLAVADAHARRLLSGRCERLVSPARYQDALGSESSLAIVALQGLLRPNVMAAAAETLRAGGLLLVAAGPRGSWSPAPPGGRGVWPAPLKGEPCWPRCTWRRTVGAGRACPVSRTCSATR